MNYKITRQEIERWIVARFNRLRQRFEEIGDKIDSCTVKERAIWFSVAIVISFLGWYFLSFIPHYKGNVTLQTRISREQQEALVLDNRYNALLGNVDELLRVENKNKLTKQLAALEKRIDAVAGSVIDAGLVTDMLRDVMVREGRLHLVSLTLLPPETLVSGGLSSGGEGDQGGALFRQRMQVVFQGDYADTLRYLKAVEASKWHLSWEKMSYAVQQYPIAQVTLTVSLLVRRRADFETVGKPATQQGGAS